jgi:ATP-binding cassette subfamily C protein LapB
MEEAPRENREPSSDGAGARPTQVGAAQQQLVVPEPHDPLVEALVFLARYYGRPQPAVTFVADLPLVEGRLPLDLVETAAERADLTTKRIKKPLADLSRLDLPAIALQSDGGVAVIVDIKKGRGKSDPRIELASRQIADGVELMPARDYKELYSGELILVRPAYSFDRRQNVIDTTQRTHWFWSAFAPNTGIYGHVIAATFAINLLTLAVPLFIRNVYDRVIPNYALDTLWALGIGVGLAAVFSLLLRILRVYLVEIAGRRADVAMSNRIFQRVLGARRDAHTMSFGHEAHIMREYETVREFFSSFTISTFGDMPFIVLFLLIIWIIGGPLVIVPTAVVIVVLLISLVTQLPLSRIAKRYFNEAAARNSVLFESLGGVETIKGIGAEGWASGRWERATAESVTVALKMRIISSLSLNLVVFAQLLTTVGIVVMGVGLIHNGTITAGALFAVVILSSRSLAPLAQIAGVLNRLYLARVAFRALKRLMDAPQDRPEGAHYVQKLTYEGGIKFDKVTFTYPGTSAPMLRDVSFQIAPGEKVGIVGTIGSGKSTLLRLLLKLYRPESGAVLVDGFDIEQLDPTSLRANIGYAPQGGDVFSGTIRSNIILHAPYAGEIAMAKAAFNVGALEWIRQRSAGFDTPVGERGALLSSGQKQSVSLARALLLDPPVLALDEPTSEMDGGTEALFLKRMAEATKNKTLIMVTHRSSALNLIDRLIVMDQGKIVADGPKKEVYEALQRLRESSKAAEPARGAAE